MRAVTHHQARASARPRAGRERDVRHRQREQQLDGKLEPRGDAARADAQLALVVGEADEAAGDETGDRRPRTRVRVDRCDQAAGDAEGGEQDAAAGWSAGLLLVALGELRLDHLARLDVAEHVDGHGIKDESDEERRCECQQVEDHLVSALTTASSPALCDALTSTRSPRLALFWTHITADSLSGTRCASEASASTRPHSLSRTATASNTSAARRPTRRWDSSARAPSSPMAPSTASSLPSRGRSAMVSKAASMDSGLALYASSTMVTPFDVMCSCRRCGTATLASAAAPSSTVTPANSPAASAASALRAWWRPSRARCTGTPRTVNSQPPPAPAAYPSPRMSAGPKPKLRTGAADSPDRSAKNGSSALRTARPFGGSAPTSSPLPRASCSWDAKNSMWTTPMLVMMPTAGRASSARRPMSPACCIPISTTSALCSGWSWSMVRGTPVSVFRLPDVLSTMYWRSRIAATISLVDVLPLLPVTPTTSGFTRLRT